MAKFPAVIKKAPAVPVLNKTVNMMTTLIFIFGLIIGSFLNVCIYRLPRKKSIISPRSACPACGRQLAWFDLIPVVSYILLRGQCRYCGTAVSRRYPLVEVLTGAMFSLAYVRLGATIDFLTAVVLVSVMVTAAFIDIEHKIIPNSLVLFGFAAGVALGLLRAEAGVKFIGLGFLAGFGLLFLVAVLSRGQMGFGDVKLAAVMGVFLGWQGVLTAFFIAFIGGAVYGLFLMIFKGKSRKTAVPFGPFLAGAEVISLFWSSEIINWYLNFIF